jgi:aryl-alcohol dehydrogenase-like predicted oxidoreductase
MVMRNQLGVDGPLVSALGMGTLYLSTNQEYLFNSAYEAGINHFDTADSYNEGASDNLISAFLKGKPRENIVLSSKVFYPTNFGSTQSGLNKDHILESVDLSLKRLNTDYLDVLYLHRYDSQTSFEESLEAIATLLEQGKIKYWGVSAFTTYQLCEVYFKAKLYGVAAPIVLQHAYNLFNRTIELELKEALDNLKIKVVGYYGLAQGILSGKYSNGKLPTGSRAQAIDARKTMWDFTPKRLEQAGAFALFCADRGLNPAAAALGWCLHNRQVASMLTHINSLNQLRVNLESLAVTFTVEDRLHLQSIFNNKPINLYTRLAY